MLSILTLVVTVIFISCYLESDEGQTLYYRLKRTNDVRKYMDITVDPCDDFYQYACGHWSDFHPIVDDQVENNVFGVLEDKLYAETRMLLEHPESSSDWHAEKQAKIFYKSCMNTDILKDLGLKPVFEFVELLGGWPVLNQTWNEQDFDWLSLISKLDSEYGFHALLTVSIFENFKNNKENQIYIYEAESMFFKKKYNSNGVSKYYLNTNVESLIEVLELFGVTKGVAKATLGKMIDFEYNLISIGTNRQNDAEEELSEFLSEIQIQELINKHPEIDWTIFISNSLGYNVTSSQSITVVNPKYIPHLLEVVSTTPKITVANYIITKVVKKLINFVDDSEIGKFKQSSPHSSNRWKECIYFAKQNFQHPIGSMYIREFYDSRNGNEVAAMAKHIKNAFISNISKLYWIDFKTKSRIKVKLRTMKSIIGHPDYLLFKDSVNKNYEGINLHPEKYLENFLQIHKNENKIRKNKFNENFDKEETFLNPITPSPIYSTRRNRLNIPAGVLQYPVFNRRLPKSISYAQIGAILSREMTRAFDENGRQFNELGNHENWWHSDAISNFKTRSKCFGAQYNAFDKNKKQFLSDSIEEEIVADNGAVRLAFEGYKNWFNFQTDDEILQNEKLPSSDFTNFELFFISYAQNWCGDDRTDSGKQTRKIDGHNLSKFRILGALKNFEEFSGVFNCSVGSNLNPEKKCRVW